jgi:hypothetical protein
VLDAEGRADEARAAARVAIEVADRDGVPWWLLRALQAEDDPATIDRRGELAATLGLPPVAGAPPTNRGGRTA